MNIGQISIENPICLAPMEDVSDQAFRVICRRMGADIVYTEFTSSEAIIRTIPKALNKISVCDEERPVAIQLFGGLESSMEKATRIATRLKPDFIDINCGCWVKNHVARGEGAALLKDLKHFEKIVRSTVNATHLPVTVKTRLGWDDNSIVILDVAKMVEDAGAKALTVHCRTRSQAHDGNANWEWLSKIKNVISIPLFGNGDVQCAQDALNMLKTGCDGVMIGRAAIGNPWLFNEIKSFLSTGIVCTPPSIKERIEVCLEHLKLTVKLKGEQFSIRPFRKYYAGYLKGFSHIASLRTSLMQFTQLSQIEDCLSSYLDKYESITSSV